MASIGYARVSSVGQSLDIQLDKLNQVGGCNRVFREKKSGTSTDRPELTACLSYLRGGDTLVITKLDRLARSTYHLTQIMDSFSSKGVELKVLDQDIDTNTPTGKLLFNVLASIAEFETDIRKERQTDGIAKAKEHGVKFGAKPKVTPKQVLELKEDRSKGIKIKDLMVKYSLSKASIYRYLS